MGEDCERGKQTRNGNNGIYSRKPHRRHWREHGETRCEGKTETDIKFDVIFYDAAVPYHERKWIDVEPGRFDKSCLAVSNLMIGLLRLDDIVPRENDAAVKFPGLASILRSEFTSSSHWSIRTWLRFLQRGGGIKKRFQYCVDLSSPETLQNLQRGKESTMQPVSHLKRRRKRSTHPYWTDS